MLLFTFTGVVLISIALLMFFVDKRSIALSNVFVTGALILISDSLLRVGIHYTFVLLGIVTFCTIVVGCASLFYAFNQFRNQSIEERVDRWWKSPGLDIAFFTILGFMALLHVVGAFIWAQEPSFMRWYLFFSLLFIYGGIVVIGYFMHFLLLRWNLFSISPLFLFTWGIEGESVHELSYSTKSYLDKISQLYKQYDEQPMIILSGGYLSSVNTVQADIMMEYLLKLGVPGEAIICERSELSMEMMFAQLKQRLETLHISGLGIFVTDELSLVRPSLMAMQQKIDVSGMGVQLEQDNKVILLIRELRSLIRDQWLIHTVIILIYTIFSLV